MGLLAVLPGGGEAALSAAFTGSDLERGGGGIIDQVWIFGSRYGLDLSLEIPYDILVSILVSSEVI